MVSHIHGPRWSSGSSVASIRWIMVSDSHPSRLVALKVHTEVVVTREVCGALHGTVRDNPRLCVSRAAKLGWAVPNWPRVFQPLKKGRMVTGLKQLASVSSKQALFAASSLGQSKWTALMAVGQAYLHCKMCTVVTLLLWVLGAATHVPHFQKHLGEHTLAAFFALRAAAHFRPARFSQRETAQLKCTAGKHPVHKG